MTKQKSLILFIIFIFLISIFIFVSTAFFSKKSDIGGQITLKELDFTIYGDMDNNTIVMPGDTTKVDCYVLNSRDIDCNDYNNLTDIYVRFSLNMVCGKDIIPVDILQESDDFIFLNETYYYLNKLPAGEFVNIIKYIKFPENLQNTYNGKKISFELSVDAIQATNDAIMELWSEFYEYVNL